MIPPDPLLQLALAIGLMAGVSGIVTLVWAKRQDAKLDRRGSLDR